MPGNGWVWAALVLALGLVAVAVWRVPATGAATRLARRRRPPRSAFRSDAVDEPRKRAVVIVNPTKVDDLEALRGQLVAAFAAHDGWDPPEIALTTESDPGGGQARAALATDPDVICVLGGDGTVRAVAHELAGTDTPMGLLPGGTGNLLARNIGMDLDDVDKALTTAIAGRNERLDVGKLQVDVAGDGTDVRDYVFLVMAGLGFDAAIMADAPEDLKAKVGWPAYVVAGAKNLRGERFKVAVTVGGDDGEVVEAKTRTVVIGNCGKLLGGITLMPEARIDDGLLDSVLLSPNGIGGWVAVATRVIRRAAASHPRVDRYTATRFVVRPTQPQEVQVDGDHLGPARAITAEVWPKALIVRMDQPYAATVASAAAYEI